MTDLSQMSDADLMGALGKAKQPRGIRNNNPGNIEDGGFARSQRGYKGGDGRFAVYDTPDSGAAAQGALLRSYGARGINSVEGIVNRWAPPSENDTGDYVGFVAQRLGVDPKAPLDLNDDRVLSSLQRAMADRENGQGGEVAAMSDAELMASLGGARSPPPAPLPALPRVPQRTQPGKPATEASRGFVGELARVADRVAPYSPLALIPGYRERLDQGRPQVRGFIDKQGEAKTTAGKAGAFGADLLASIGVSGPLSPLVGGAVSGVATGTATDAKGVAKEAAGGALLSRLTAAGSDALQLGARKALSKAPQIMKLPELEAAKKAAYEAVDKSGFVFPKQAVASLVADFDKAVGSQALSKSAKEDAASIIEYARGLAKGDVSLSQMEKLRGDIYDALVKKGGDTANVGGKFRAKIDALMDATDDSLVRTARGLNARWKKADYITRAAGSADLAAERTYGGDFGRKVKDRIAPLVDPLSKQKNFRGATPDETAALNKVARGTKTQNLASAVGGMTDPRRMGGKVLAGALSGLTGGAGLATGGASLPVTLALQGAQVLAGLGLTGKSSSIARKNVDELIRLVAAGGSKQALKPVATPASEAAEKLVARLVRPGAVAAAVPALAASKRQNPDRPAPRPKPKAKRSDKGR